MRRNAVKEAMSVRERIDPITVSVIQHRLEGSAQEMGEAMVRTACSRILNSSWVAAAPCDADGQLAAKAQHVPIHVGATPWAVRSVRESIVDRIRRRDVYLLNVLNDLYRGHKPCAAVRRAPRSVTSPHDRAGRRHVVAP